MMDFVRVCPTIAPSMKATPRHRLPATARKAAIARAALPLFARRGFDGVSTRDLARASGVSEALLFRYYPTKRALFDEIRRQHAQNRQTDFDRFAPLPASTANLVKLVCLFVHGVVVEDAQRAAPVMHLFYRSLIDDDDFARKFLRSSFLRELKRRFSLGMAAARAAGDALPVSTPDHDLFWFVQHVATAACLVRLRKPPAIRYRTAESDAVGAISRFALRGVGVTAEAIETNATAEHIAAWIAEITAG
jgi:AcrR family transcriptional regulator